MTGRPIDTEAMRNVATAYEKVAGDYRQSIAGGLLHAAARDVLALCDALDAARAEIERVRTLLVLERRERPDKYGPDYRGDGSWEIAREALGEEKQR